MALGVGMLGIPKAMHESGVILGVLLIVVSCVTAYTFYVYVFNGMIRAEALTKFGSVLLFYDSINYIFKIDVWFDILF